MTGTGTSGSLTRQTSSLPRTYTNAKVIVVGDSGVGKTSIALRFISDVFDEHSVPTLGASFLSKTHVGDNATWAVKFDIWDTAGQERYRSVARSYYRGCQAAILICDLTRKESFTELSRWIDDIRENGPERIVYAVVGSKSDLDEWAVSEEDLEAFATSIGGKAFICSSKTGVGVYEIFDWLGSTLSPEDVAPSQGGKGRVLLSAGVSERFRASCC